MGGSQKVQKCADVIQGWSLICTAIRSFQQRLKLCSSLLDLNKSKNEKRKKKEKIKKEEKNARKVKVRSAITLSKKGSYLHCK